MLTEAFPLLLWENPWAVPPALIYFAGAALVALSGRWRMPRLQQLFLLLTPVIGLINFTGLVPGQSWVWPLLDFELVLLRVDRLSQLFGVLFHLATVMAVIYALRDRDTLQHSAALVYAGSALGAVFAGDLMSLFFYWEGMAVSSAFLVWASRSQLAQGAGFRYLAQQLLSGLLLLAAALLHYRDTGSLAFDWIGTESLAGWLLLLAFGIKAGFPLLHTWITDAYPAATRSGTVFLSIFTTKCAVYTLARGYAGTELLVAIGAAMAVFPIFYAVIENDLRRVLGYSMINQIGFMVAGIGVGTELALNGTVAHAFAHIIYKSLLFMSMGAVLLRIGHVRGSDLGGLYKSMPWTTTCCVIGAAAISAFPLFSGFVAKSMIMSALILEHHRWAWLLLLFASAGVFHHAGIKVPYFAFFSHDAGLRTREAPFNMLLAMGIAAALCIAIGCYPALLYDLLPWPAEYHPYTYSHVLAQLQLLLFSALAFVWLNLVGIYPPELRSVHLDADWLYRRLVPAAVRTAGAPLASLFSAAGTRLRQSGRTLAASAGYAAPANIGVAVLAFSAVLGAYVLVFLLTGQAGG